jgi:hypothetical protein
MMLDRKTVEITRQMLEGGSYLKASATAGLHDLLALCDDWLAMDAELERIRAAAMEEIAMHGVARNAEGGGEHG